MLLAICTRRIGNGTLRLPTLTKLWNGWLPEVRETQCRFTPRMAKLRLVGGVQRTAYQREGACNEENDLEARDTYIRWSTCAREVAQRELPQGIHRLQAVLDTRLIKLLEDQDMHTRQREHSRASIQYREHIRRRPSTKLQMQCAIRVQWRSCWPESRALTSRA